jgi:hypothetical protein
VKLLYFAIVNFLVKPLKRSTVLNSRQFKAFYHKFWPLSIFFFRGYLVVQTNIFKPLKTYFMQQKELLTKLDVAGIGEEISHEMGADFINAYKNANPGATLGYTVGRNIIDRIFAQPGCVGLRIYNAINELGQTTLVYVGVDAQGKDIKKTINVDVTGNIVEQNAIVGDRVGPQDPNPTKPWWWPTV